MFRRALSGPVETLRGPIKRESRNRSSERICGSLKVTAMLLLGVAVADALVVDRAVAGDILTFGANDPVWNAKLGVTGIRLGCSGQPKNCIAGAKGIAASQLVRHVYIATLFLVSTPAAMREYASLIASAPEVAEIGFDDFGSQCLRLLRSGQDPKAILDETLAVARAAKIGVGITLYENELLTIPGKCLSEHGRSGISYVHFYLLYRKDVAKYRNYLASAAGLFPHAAIIAGAYAYDRADYLSCSPESKRHCTATEEVSLFQQSIELETRLLDAGELSGIEFYPGEFGRQASWKGWSNGRICAAERVPQCVRQTELMRNIALATLQRRRKAGK